MITMEPMISNLEIYGLEESIIASGYPKATSPHPWYKTEDETDRKRAKRLAGAKPGSGHDCFLKGIIVQFDLTISEKMWPQLQRYHFIEFVSSMSTMHMLANMDIQFSPYVDEEIKARFLDLVETYKKYPSEDNWLKMIYNYPSGMLLTARISTNYLQLKTIYEQRKNHRLPEWKEFCKFIKKLPLFSIGWMGKITKGNVEGGKIC